MAATEFDWSEVSGQAVERLRAPKVAPVPDSIVKLAQMSYDGVPDPKNPENTLHVLRHQFKDEAKAVAFAKIMKKAGDHVMTTDGKGGSVSVVPDPDGDGNVTLVAWKAGARRGRTPASA